MTRTEAWLQHVSNLLVGGTGIVYAWMRYLAEPEDEFALVNHAWQPDVQHLHVIVAPVLVFAVGVIWSQHVWSRIRAGLRARRPTGLVLAASFVPMIASGYLLQTAVEDGWRTAWIVVHVTTSTLWILGYLVHQLSSRDVGPVQ